jgi:hypothetical protein
MRQWIRLSRRFLALPTERRKLLFEACLYLVWARLILLVLPFRRLTPFFNRPSPPAMILDPVERRRLRQDVGWAIELAGRHLPGETTCFPRGIAAQAMCRRRGVGAVLCYGAATLPETGLSAHVWVLDGTEGVVGHQAASDYRILARFPVEDRAQLCNHVSRGET